MCIMDAELVGTRCTSGASGFRPTP
jgi:hypothetical protein